MAQQGRQFQEQETARKGRSQQVNQTSGEIDVAFWAEFSGKKTERKQGESAEQRTPELQP